MVRRVLTDYTIPMQHHNRGSHIFRLLPHPPRPLSSPLVCTFDLDGTWDMGHGTGRDNIFFTTSSASDKGGQHRVHRQSERLVCIKSPSPSTPYHTYNVRIFIPQLDHPTPALQDIRIVFVSSRAARI